METRKVSWFITGLVTLVLFLVMWISDCNEKEEESGNKIELKTGDTVFRFTYYAYGKPFTIKDIDTLIIVDCKYKFVQYKYISGGKNMSKDIFINCKSYTKQ